MTHGLQRRHGYRHVSAAIVRNSCRASRNESVASALVLIGAIGVQPITATTRRRIEEPVLQVVLTEKPVERPPRLCQPPPVAVHAVRVEARRHHRAGLDRLLIEVAGDAALIEPAGSDGAKLSRETIALRAASRASASRPRPCLADACDHRRRSAPARDGRCSRSRSPRTMASRVGSSAQRGRAADRRAPDVGLRPCCPLGRLSTRRCRGARRPRLADW